MQFLLDTDTCIFYSRRTSPSVAARVSSYAPGDLVISAVTYGELRFGAEKTGNPAVAREVLDAFTQAVPVISLEPQVGEHYGRTRLYLQRKGLMIGNNDLWIASHCLHLGLTLITNNEREFSRIPNLATENWTH
jgi:tRNA(fMet)-specific endonuclease VapC